MSNSIYVIYKHTCRVTNKSYIGQTKDISARTKNHLSARSGCIAFRNAIVKYGWDSFYTEILYVGLTLDEANQQEEECIRLYNTVVPNGYNLNSGGLNKLHCEETKRKMSAAKKGKPSPTKGHVLSEDHKAKLSVAKLKMTATTKDKLSQAKIGSNNPNYGKPGTMLGRKQTPESIQRRLESRKRNAERKKQMAEVPGDDES